MKVPKINVLFSYYYLRQNEPLIQLLIDLSSTMHIMIDSGAFTNRYQRIKALKEGRGFNAVTLKEYIEVCQTWHGKFWEYIQLDVIADGEATRKNLKAMLKEGLRPMPVFQHGESYARLPEYLAVNQRISVGGIAGDTPGNHPDYARKRYSQLYLKSKKKAKIHALGWLKWPDVFKLPLKYGDSSSYCSGGRFGQIATFDDRTGFSAPGYQAVFAKPHTKKSQRAIGWMRRCNIPPAWIDDQDYYRRVQGIPGLMSTYAYIRFHLAAVRHKFGFFFAVPNVNWFTPILAVIKNATNTGFDYPQARQDKEGLDELWKKDRGRFTAQAKGILEKYTDQSVVLD